MTAQSANGRELMKIPDVARRLNIGRSMVYELIRRGDLRTIHIGRAVRVEVSAVDELIDTLAGAADANDEPVGFFGRR